MTDAYQGLRQRAERGTARGGEAVWDAATEHPYVAEPDPAPRSSAALWWVAGAAACALVVAGLALRPTDSGEVSVAYEGDGSSAGPASCLLEVAGGTDRTLPDWAAVAEDTDGISGVDIVDVRSGTASFLMLGHPNVEVPTGTRGISFQARPASAARELGDDPEVARLMCWVAPAWAWVPDEPPAGSRPVIAFYNPEAAADVAEHWRTILTMEGVLAAELITQQQAYEEFVELFADTAEMVDAVSPAVMPPSVRIVVDADLADDLIARLKRSPGMYRVVEPPPPLWSSSTGYEPELPDVSETSDTGSTSTTAITTRMP